MSSIRRLWVPALALAALAVTGCNKEPAALTCPTGVYCPAGARCATDQAICIFNSCGDHVREGEEACDDGNNLDGDGCSADCMSDETCGNGRTDAVKGEEC